jgi:tetratricopeptide (TPR) repeat protein
LESDIEPISLTVGIYYGHWFHRFLTARLTVDGSVDTSSNVTGGGGVEIQIFRNYDLRAGYLWGQGFSTGVGVRLLDFEVAYAALFRGNVIAHNFSVNWMIGESRKAKGYRLASEEKESIDLAVSRSVDEEKSRLARIQEDIQKKILSEQQRVRETAERQVRELIASNETSLALAGESNRLVMEQFHLSNELHLTQVTLSNQLAFDTLKNTTQQWVDTVRRSNEILLQELTQSNQQWAEALRISNQMWAETARISNQAALAKVTKSNELAIKTLIQANNQAREVLAAKARDNINKLNREIADTKARQKTIETMYNSALAAFNTGNADEALVQFKKILELDPNNLEVLNFVKKIEDSKRPVENYSAEEVELYREGMKHFLKKDYGKAVEVWESLLKRYPYNNLAIQGIEKAKKRQKGN